MHTWRRNDLQIVNRNRRWELCKKKHVTRWLQYVVIKAQIHRISRQQSSVQSDLNKVQNITNRLPCSERSQTLAEHSHNSSAACIELLLRPQNLHYDRHEKKGTETTLHCANIRKIKWLCDVELKDTLLTEKQVRNGRHNHCEGKTQSPSPSHRKENKTCMPQPAGSLVMLWPLPLTFWPPKLLHTFLSQNASTLKVWWNSVRVNKAIITAIVTAMCCKEII